MTNISEKGLIGIGLAGVVAIIAITFLFKSNKSETSSNNEFDHDVNSKNQNEISEFPRIEGGRKKSKKQKKRVRINNSRKRR